MGLIDKIRGAIGQGSDDSGNDNRQNGQGHTDIFDEMSFNHRLHSELLFIEQPDKNQIRIFDDAPLTLGAFLKRIFDIEAASLKYLQVVTDDSNGKDWHDVEGIANYDILSDLIYKKEDGSYECIGGGHARNVMLHVIYSSELQYIDAIMKQAY